MNSEYSEEIAEAVTKEKLVADFKVVVADAEELLRATASDTGEKVAAVRARVQDSLREAKERLAEVEAHVRAKTKLAARAADDYVQENPWKAVGVAASVGLVIGLLIGRR
ncbi:MAG: DUF883 family protein [Sulfuricellaceae bacterium]|nr:DUF883 family protein [Sulfuricellaceae bacterium]